MLVAYTGSYVYGYAPRCGQWHSSERRRIRVLIPFFVRVTQKNDDCDEENIYIYARPNCLYLVPRARVCDDSVGKINVSYGSTQRYVQRADTTPRYISRARVSVRKYHIIIIINRLPRRFAHHIHAGRLPRTPFSPPAEGYASSPCALRLYAHRTSHACILCK